MKRIYFLLFLVALGSLAQAQMPKAINYQAVARNAQGQALANQPIKIRLSILNTANGNATLYSETRTVTTNALGLFNLQIGSAGASSTTGDFNSINWLNNTTSTESLKVELDINNSGTFTDMGAQSLSSVPYAFAANEAVNAANIGGHYVDTNTPSTGDLLRWDGSAWVAESANNFLPKTISFNSTPNQVAGGSLAFAWSCTPTLVTITAGQRITGSITQTVATSSGTSTQVGFGLCYQMANDAGVGNGPIIHFQGTNYPTIAQISTRMPLSASGSITGLQPGKYLIGFAVRNISATPLNANDAAGGFFIISNE